MKKYKNILNKIEAIIYLIVLVKVVPLRFSISYNICFFLFDFTFVLFLVIEWFSYEIFKKNYEITLEKCELFFMRIVGILCIIILAKYTDFFEGLYSIIFK